MDIGNWLDNKTKNLTGETNPVNPALVATLSEKAKSYQENPDPDKLIKEKMN